MSGERISDQDLQALKDLAAQRTESIDHAIARSIADTAFIEAEIERMCPPKPGDSGATNEGKD